MFVGSSNAERFSGFARRRLERALPSPKQERASGPLQPAERTEPARPARRSTRERSASNSGARHRAPQSGRHFVFLGKISCIRVQRY